MAILTEKSTGELLKLGANNVAILGYRASAAGNVNVMFGEVVEYASTDGGAFNAFFGGDSLKSIRRAWQTMKPEIAESMFGIKDASESFNDAFIANPKAGDKFAKVQWYETMDSEKGNPIVNPTTGEVVVGPNGSPIHRVERVILADTFDHQEAYNKLPRLEVTIQSDSTVGVPFDVAAM